MTMYPVRKTPGERGSALILFSLMTWLLVMPMVGLAIDGSILYLARTRMVAAVDAAALAGGRSLNVGLDFSTQKQSAESTATAYFKANFPLNYLNTVNVVVTPDAEEQTNHTRTVAVQASGDVNLYFMRLLGFNTATISASAQTARRDVNVMLVLDRSGSMVGVCGTMKASATSFVQKFTNGRDKVGLITFMGSPGNPIAPTVNFLAPSPSVPDAIASISCGGNTGSAEALAMAHQSILQAQQPGALNVIVFFTDGVPNGFLASYPMANATCNAGKNAIGYISDSGGIYGDDRPANNSTQYSLLQSSPDTFATCNFRKRGAGQVGNDIAAIPDVDASSFPPVLPNSVSRSNYRAIPEWQGTDGKYYIGKGTDWNKYIDSVSIDAADDAAAQIRQDGIFLYTIGLDGDGGVDSTLLARMANDASSRYYNKNQPTGLYEYSPNAGQLASAFNSIASEILRIAK